MYDTTGAWGRCLLYLFLLKGMAINMEKIFEQALLYDFYGDLLTEHQRQVYESAVFDDMSLGEIASSFAGDIRKDVLYNGVSEEFYI